ncbi:MAG TPA: hypothetical protein VIY48_02095 [Candidatus Paceibacterota bacterium]
MATNTLARLVGPTAAASGTSTLYTGTAAHTYTIKKIKVVNTDVANTKTFQLFINGSAAGNAITPVLTVDAGGYAESDEFMVLSGTDTLQITTSATGLTVSVYGLDQT